MTGILEYNGEFLKVYTHNHIHIHYTSLLHGSFCLGSLLLIISSHLYFLALPNVCYIPKEKFHINNLLNKHWVIYVSSLQ